MTIGQRIRNRRIEMSMTQEQLANKIGYKERSVICHIEKGDHSVSIPTLEKIAEALKCSPAYLAGWSEEVSV